MQILNTFCKWNYDENIVFSLQPETKMCERAKSQYN